MTSSRPRSERFERGLKTRREVLGDAHVDRSLAAATDFNWSAQTLATENGRGTTIWNRPGLDRKTRSLLNLGMLAALNRPHEFKAHVRGAINNGVTVAEFAGNPAAYRRLLRHSRRDGLFPAGLGGAEGDGAGVRRRCPLRLAKPTNNAQFST